MRFSGRRSGLIAKDRLRLLLTSERLDCTPQMMTMLKNDMIKAAAKYVPVDSPGVTVSFRQSPPMLTANIPLKNRTPDIHT